MNVHMNVHTNEDKSVSSILNVIMIRTGVFTFDLDFNEQSSLSADFACEDTSHLISV